jgi:undecaprenyl-diphosphatase
MDYLQALMLSIVEGISEFLPISSTGHLILASDLLHIQQTEFVKSFEIFIQLGAILAVVVLYWKTFFTNSEGWKKVLAAFIPTAIIGFILYKFIKQFLLGNTYITVLALLIGGILLILLELLYKEKEHHVDKLENISYKNAVLIGIAQSLAVIPGVSRSAATIICALFVGTKRKAAVEFSFLLAAPTMLAATVLDITKSNFSFSSSQWSLLLVGFLGAFITAIFAIKFLLQFIKNHTFIPFGIYRIILAILFWLLIIK